MCVVVERGGWRRSRLGAVGVLCSLADYLRRATQPFGRTSTRRIAQRTAAPPAPASTRLDGRPHRSQRVVTSSVLSPQPSSGRRPGWFPVVRESDAGTNCDHLDRDAPTADLSQRVDSSGNNPAKPPPERGGGPGSADRRQPVWLSGASSCPARPAGDSQPGLSSRPESRSQIITRLVHADGRCLIRGVESEVRCR